MELTQVRLIVEDFGSVFRYYRDVLGLRPQVDDDRGPYGKLTFPRGAVAIALQSRAHAETALGRLRAPGDCALIAVRVDDLASVRRDLEARGGAFLPTPDDAFGPRMRVAHLRDPEGNLLELQEWVVAKGGPGPGRGSG